MKLKISITFFLILFFAKIPLALDNQAAVQKECVIVLHGLLRTRYSMRDIEKSLTEKGYTVWNKSYPSREKLLEELTEIAIKPALEFCQKKNASRINFVTHSLGGILVRFYLQDNSIDNLHRIVMLSPPNHGTELADYLKDFEIYKKIYGPVGQQLGVNSSIIKNLKPIPGQIGIIVGKFSPNPWFSSVIPGEDDGIVSVEGSKLLEMRDFLVLDYGHTFIMQKSDVIDEIVAFLQHGRFRQKNAVLDVKKEQ